jgi:hypothetical protein
VQRVEGDMRLVAERHEQLAAGGGAPPRRCEVEILVRPPERLRQAVRGAQDDGDPSEQPQRDSLGLGKSKNPPPLGDHVGQRTVHEVTLLQRGGRVVRVPGRRLSAAGPGSVYASRERR